LRKVSPIFMICFISLIGSLGFIPGMLRELQGWSFSQLTPTAIWGILFGTLITCVVGHYFLIYGLSKINAEETGLFAYIDPVSAYLFLQKGYEVVALDNFSTGYRQPLEVLQEKFGQEKMRFYEADLTSDISSVFDKEKNIDAVVHYAAHCLVDESMKNPVKYF